MNTQLKATTVLVAVLTIMGMGAAADYTELTDKLTEEKVWGDGTQEITDPDRILHVTVEKYGDHLRFIGESSTIDGDSGETVTFDADSDGTADFKVQYRNGQWMYDEVVSTESGPEWAKQWEAISSDAAAYMEDGKFSIAVPVKVLAQDGRSYRFGMQVNTEPGQQILYPDGDGLWWNGDTYTSSDKYRAMTIDHYDPDTTIEDTTKVEKRSDSSIFNVVLDRIDALVAELDNYFARDSRVEELEQQVTELEKQVNYLEESKLDDRRPLDKTKTQSIAQFMAKHGYESFETGDMSCETYTNFAGDKKVRCVR